ncbi:hypothetical protein SEA_PARADIDDLES_30 [Streptomyces phage Paradiddles]|jgi:hypothetical protein|uniref:Uncharacterized protein n=3 Tax=Samistivirus TaxID=2560220 RepID=A0A514U1R9_9CAUD|nr:hypothetical protein FDI36_gp030 [Streptomyces phage NootNoot]YP_009611027.1 hypothetical protein FDI37_gp030 [Streptomyces phage Paradiddles]YP_010103926.1 hypothetical protein KNU71_gp033 [Streptomyces phage Braelyn]UGL63034.1 hypothetical protein SEA_BARTHOLOMUNE_33 [Streptomyces phage Bartholomune]UOW93466.1 hypothetical protein SEA_SQUILLIUM_33 [Streptomyces phage Squillium]WNM72913.1 hypothetical protein SEA_PERSIMMON_30 [Streptomyces phage Persimmon]WNM73298.1 hypothetical protein S
MRAELELLLLTDSAGLNRNLVTALISEIKQDAVEADNAYENEVSNLRNAIEEATHNVESVLRTLRDA